MIDVATPNDNGGRHSWTIEDLLESISAEPELWVRAVAAWITERSVPFRSAKSTGSPPLVERSKSVTAPQRRVALATRH